MLIATILAIACYRLSCNIFGRGKIGIMRAIPAGSRLLAANKRQPGSASRTVSPGGQ